MLDRNIDWHDMVPLDTAHSLLEHTAAHEEEEEGCERVWFVLRESTHPARRAPVQPRAAGAGAREHACSLHGVFSEMAVDLLHQPRGVKRKRRFIFDKPLLIEAR